MHDDPVLWYLAIEKRMPGYDARRAHERRFLPQCKKGDFKGQHSRRADSLKLLEEGLSELGGQQRFVELPDSEKDDVKPLSRLVFLQDALAKGGTGSIEIGQPTQALP